MPSSGSSLPTPRARRVAGSHADTSFASGTARCRRAPTESCSHARARGLDPEPEVCVSHRNRSERRSPTRPAPALRSQTWPAISRIDWLDRDAATGRAERHPHARPRDHLVACAPRAATRGSRAPSRVRANRTSRANTQPLIKKLTTTTSAADRPGGEKLPRGICKRHRRGRAPTRKRSGVRMRQQPRLRGRRRPCVGFREEKRSSGPGVFFVCGNTIFLINKRNALTCVGTGHVARRTERHRVVVRCVACVCVCERERE